MRSYEEIPEFKYYDKDSWKNFISDHIKHLNHLSSELLEFRDFILKNGKTLSEIEKNRSDLLPFLLGGIDKDGEYKKDSLAKFVKLALGIGVNAKQWVTLERDVGKEASGRISIEEEETQFFGSLKNLREITSAIMWEMEIEPEEIQDSEIEEIVKNPEKLLEIVKEIYIECLNASANHSYYTFFALSTRNLPYGFMIAAYPKLESNLEDDFLGLEKIFEPEIGDEEVKKKYTIWGHEKDGLCDLLYKLNELIWKGFSDEKVKEVFSYVSTSVNDLRGEYRQKVEKELKKSGWRLDYVKESASNDYLTAKDLEWIDGRSKTGAGHHIYLIDKFLLTQEMLKVYTNWEHPWDPYVPKQRPTANPRGLIRVRECNPPISLKTLFDDLAPALFLYYVELRFYENICISTALPSKGLELVDTEIMREW